MCLLLVEAELVVVVGAVMAVWLVSVVEVVGTSSGRSSRGIGGARRTELSYH